jgi:hypothetical protein
VGSRGGRPGGGKSGRVVHVRGKRTTLEGETEPVQTVHAWSEEPSVDEQPKPPSTKNKYQVCDLYAVRGASAAEEAEEQAKPFVHEVRLLGPSREVVRVCAIFNDGAMIGTMCITIYEKVKHRLQGWCPSQRVLCMANGTLVKSQATWTGTIDLNGVRAQGTLEVFDSREGGHSSLGSRCSERSE